MIKAQKDAMQIALAVSKKESLVISKSGSYGESMHVVQGKYARKTRPYVILKSRSKTQDLPAKNFGMDRTLDRGKRNWANVAHFGILGVDPQNKTAGQSKGRPSKGKAFAFFDPDKNGGLGGIVVVKKIKHTGNLGYPVYDKALKTSGRAVENTFRQNVSGILNEFLKKQGAK